MRRKAARRASASAKFNPLSLVLAPVDDIRGWARDNLGVAYEAHLADLGADLRDVLTHIGRNVPVGGTAYVTHDSVTLAQRTLKAEREAAATHQVGAPWGPRIGQILEQVRSDFGGTKNDDGKR